MPSPGWRAAPPRLRLPLGRLLGSRLLGTCHVVRFVLRRPLHLLGRVRHGGSYHPADRAVGRTQEVYTEDAQPEDERRGRQGKRPR